MKNEELTKLARWIVPGWISLLSFYAFVLVDTIFSIGAQPRLYSSLHALFSDLSEVNTVLVSVAVAAAGVPLGFIVYQLYFFLRWNSPYSRDGLFALIPGRMQDLKHSLLNLTKTDITLGEKWRKNIVQHPLFDIDHSFRWRYIELLFTEAVQFLDKPGTSVGLYSRHRYLHEVVHTLGASIGAIYIGFSGYLILKLHKETVSLSIYVLTTVFFTFSLMYLMDRENQWREHLSLQTKFTDDERKNIKEKSSWPLAILFLDGRVAFPYPSSFLLVSLAFLHFFANPYIAPSRLSPYDLIARMGMMAVASVLWVVATSRSKEKSAIIGSAFESGIGLLGAIVGRYFQHLLDWPFLGALFLFLALNLVFFQNRRNAKGDMLALEYQTLRRYIESKKESRNEQR